MKEEHEIVIIGAGFAGLSCAAKLKKHQATNFRIIEKENGCGGFWRGNYDRIRLHTPFHALPDDGGIRRDYDQFMPRNDLVEYLERYADHHGLLDSIVTNTYVESIVRARDHWAVKTNREELHSKYLVVATAYNRKPVLPTIPGMTDFEGTAIHSRDYRNAEPFNNVRALIIGSGNSAAEIALDLSEGGASSVMMLVRGPRHVLSLRGLGIAAKVARALRIELTPQHIEASHAYTRSHPDFLAKLAEKDKFFSTFSIDMSAYGISRPESGPATQIAVHGRVPWMDQGTVKAIKRGNIGVINAKLTPLKAITKDGAELEYGLEPLDLIVYATGLEPGLDEMFDDSRFLEWNAEMARLMPRTNGRSQSTVEPTLFFPGFDLSANGGLSLGLWGFECADEIQKHRTLNIN